MPPTPPSRGFVRSAAAVNEEIRALWQQAGGTLNPEQRARYEQLLVEWEAALRGEVTEAA